MTPPRPPLSPGAFTPQAEADLNDLAPVLRSKLPLTHHHPSLDPYSPRPPFVFHPQGAFTLQIEADLKDLAAMLRLKPKEAADIRAEVAANLYRRLLKEEVSSRRIDAAESPAKVGCQRDAAESG